MIRRAILATVLVAFASQPALARTLTTGLIFPDGDNELVCSVINVDPSREVVVRIDAVDFDGDVVSHTPVNSLLPGEVAGLNVAADEGAQYCRFELVQGSRRSVRASGCVFTHGTGCLFSTNAS